MKPPKEKLPASDFHELLATRCREIARRRVPEDEVEDLVQETMAIVLEKGPAAAAGAKTPPLRWCFQVLRNVIGNWYQRQRSHESLEGQRLVDPGATPLEALTQAERSNHVREAMDDLKASSPDCARWLWALAQGTKPAALALKAGVAASIFYRRIYKCRAQLALLLKARGVEA